MEAPEEPELPFARQSWRITHVDTQEPHAAFLDAIVIKAAGNLLCIIKL